MCSELDTACQFNSLWVFQPGLLAAINNWLQMKFFFQHPNVPHKVKDIYKAAHYILQSTAITGSYYTPALAVPPVWVLQRPSTPAFALITKSPKVKTEDLSTLFSEFTKSFMDIMNQNLQGTFSSLQQLFRAKEVPHVWPHWPFHWPVQDRSQVHHSRQMQAKPGWQGSVAPGNFCSKRHTRSLA